MLAGEEEQQMTAASVGPAGKSPAQWRSGFMKHVLIRCAVDLSTLYYRLCMLSCSLNTASIKPTFQTLLHHLALHCQTLIVDWPFSPKLPVTSCPCVYAAISHSLTA